jgi:hypothetical protein
MFHGYSVSELLLQIADAETRLWDRYGLAAHTEDRRRDQLLEGQSEQVFRSEFDNTKHHS